MQEINIKNLLDTKYTEYNDADFFIGTDPIQIPKMFNNKGDIEVAGFLAASLAWGQRKTIINKAKDLINRMDGCPYDFIMNAGEEDLKSLIGFKHRTLNDYDIRYFIESLINIYRNKGGLESVFTTAYEDSKDMLTVLARFHSIFTELEHLPRVERHIANVSKGSAAKRINMFLRWMVRDDQVDFGIWKGIPTSALLIPLDVHCANVSRELGLLKRKQNDIKAVIELTQALRDFDQTDPVRYDFALFGIGAFKKD